MNNRPNWRSVTAFSLIGLASLGFTGCSDKGLTEAPPHIIVADNLYRDPAGFEAGLNALYFQVRLERNGQGNSENDILNTFWTAGVDNAFGNYVSPNERIINEWGVRNNPQASQFLGIWTWLYQTINAANTIVGRADDPAVKWSSDAEKNRVVAEARLIRAWAYRHLTYLWGDVPLNLTESAGDKIRTDFDRTPRAEVWKQMEADFQFAEQNLPATSSNPGKLVKAVAQHYLAELYLAEGQPAKAEVEAQAVIGSGLYSLITKRYGVQATQPGVPFLDQFIDGNVNRTQGNTEVLWALEYQENVAGGGANIMRRTWVNRYYSLKGLAVAPEYGGRGIGRLSPTRYAITLYEAQDQRGLNFAIRRFYLYNNAAALPAGKKLGDTLFLKYDKEKSSSPLWPSVRKWDWVDPANVTGSSSYGDQPYIRLAETYLLLAEADFKQGKLVQAADAINALRTRANATPIKPSQVTMDFILDERSRELLTEEDRRYTLLRTGTWYDRTRKYNPIAALAITPRDTLLPIPQAVIDANLTKPMPQNPGY